MLASSRLAVRRIAVSRRFQSTSTPSRPSSFNYGSHLAAAAAGGAVVGVGLYALYHFSGMKKLVDAGQAGRVYYQHAKEAIAEKVHKTPISEEEATRRKEDRQVLVNLTRENSEEAKQLARETTEDVVNLIREKADRAKRLMRRTGTEETEERKE